MLEIQKYRNMESVVPYVCTFILALMVITFIQNIRTRHRKKKHWKKIFSLIQWCFCGACVLFWVEWTVPRGLNIRAQNKCFLFLHMKIACCQWAQEFRANLCRDRKKCDSHCLDSSQGIWSHFSTWKLTMLIVDCSSLMGQTLPIFSVTSIFLEIHYTWVPQLDRQTAEGIWLSMPQMDLFLILSVVLRL